MFMRREISTNKVVNLISGRSNHVRFNSADMPCISHRVFVDGVIRELDNDHIVIRKRRDGRVGSSSPGNILGSENLINSAGTGTTNSSVLPHLGRGIMVVNRVND